MNILEIVNLAGLFFLVGWILSRCISEIEIKELKEACSYYYNQWQDLTNNKSK